MITKGKWQTGCDMSHVEVWPEGWNAPLLIADCGTKRAPELVEEQCANAQAIAALPDLIEALKACMERIEKDEYSQGWKTSEEYKQAKATLIKAGVEV